MSSKRDPNRRVAMTAAQRGRLARLRVMHPRAMVRVNARQPFLPVVQITMHYGTLLDGSASAIAGKMAAFERQQEQADNVWATNGPRRQRDGITHLTENGPICRDFW